MTRRPKRKARPTAAEVRAARKKAGLTQTQAAQVIYSTLSAWQKWESDEGAEARRMHPALFELFLLKTTHDMVAFVEAMRRVKA